MLIKAQLFVTTLIVTTTAVVFGAWAGGDSASIPPGAADRAQTWLTESWPRVLEDPAFWGLPDISEDATPRLGGGFVEFVLRRDAALAFLESADMDPRPFASYKVYRFPVWVDQICVGLVMVQANQQPDGTKFKPHEGDFIQVGYEADKSVDIVEVTDALRLRREYPREAGYVLSTVRFYDVAHHRLVIVDRPDSLEPLAILTELAADSTMSPQPLSDVSSGVKEDIHRKMGSER